MFCEHLRAEAHPAEEKPGASGGGVLCGIHLSPGGTIYLGQESVATPTPRDKIEADHPFEGLPGREVLFPAASMRFQWGGNVGMRMSMEAVFSLLGGFCDTTWERWGKPM